MSDEKIPDYILEQIQQKVDKIEPCRGHDSEGLVDIGPGQEDAVYTTGSSPYIFDKVGFMPDYDNPLESLVNNLMDTIKQYNKERQECELKLLFYASGLTGQEKIKFLEYFKDQLPCAPEKL